MTSFKVWLRKFDGDSSPIGDLAADIKRDRRFPVTRDLRKMLRYLESRQAGRDARLALVRAYAVYRREEP